MVEFAVPAGVDVASGAPGVADVFGPVPGFVIAPFTDAEQDRAASFVQRIAHGGVGADGVDVFGIAPVVFQVVDAPLGVGERVLIFMSAAAGVAGAGGVACVGVDTDLQTFGVNVIGQCFHAGRKTLFVDLDPAVFIALTVPAVIDFDVFVSGIFHSGFYHGVGHFANQFFVDFAGEGVPAVPAQRWRQAELLKLFG